MGSYRKFDSLLSLGKIQTLGTVSDLDLSLQSDCSRTPMGRPVAFLQITYMKHAFPCRLCLLCAASQERAPDFCCHGYFVTIVPRASFSTDLLAPCLSCGDQGSQVFSGQGFESNLPGSYARNVCLTFSVSGLWRRDWGKGN
jgi:hypothetical protein